eukprot:4556388-Pleurochrysis_carterae.AAC.1
MRGHVLGTRECGDERVSQVNKLLWIAARQDRFDTRSKFAALIVLGVLALQLVFQALLVDRAIVLVGKVVDPQAVGA